MEWITFDIALNKEGHVLEHLENKNYKTQAMIQVLGEVGKHGKLFGGFDIIVTVWNKSGQQIDEKKLIGLQGKNTAALKWLNKFKSEVEEKYFIKEMEPA